MADIDIDAELPPLTVAWRGREWTVNRGVPLSALADMKAEIGEPDWQNPEHALLLVAALFRVKPAELREQVDPTREELWYLLARVGQHFGVAPGESSASPATSPE